ncbi:MAG: hypothetical protein A2015_08715 [Spirochaetes bacterium GWF1_31_7]|nr:MAG: hypothetical protein A2Y30_06945 [Spirochaetes bacterium GWE1_32_154]OHD48003.1 MAG: hypothetical protein A2015_08715 [Spirochaetes bacterium GWF1_31_7]OHD49680.1 MAG: hypothetical protein A2Y29_06920 [Spirochaetes bacterium GWE2_31_10]OHD78846.1 MAG: hypothetical protein A2355_06365 [Spirochaetes bacterium RIFOXYB1_FULL_32_8]HBD92786.1 hypothetical protein [Spirochaetia bacterium]
MAFKLVKGEFKVKCKHPGCPFEHSFVVDQNIMGLTEEDVETESVRFAIGQARTKHDSIYGSKHTLESPIVRKISGIYESVGSLKKSYSNQSEAIKYKEYKKGDFVLSKGELATTICEVVKGSAFVNKAKPHYYKPGDSFGAAALLVNQVRTADVLAGEDGTTIAFFNLKELSKKDPKKAKELYTDAMEDVFNVIEDFEIMVDKLAKDLEEEKMVSENRKQRIDVLEEDLLNVTKRLSELDEGK